MRATFKNQKGAYLHHKLMTEFTMDKIGATKQVRTACQQLWHAAGSCSAALLLLRQQQAK